MLTIKGPKQSCWLIDSAANIYVCNDLRLMTGYLANPIKVRNSTSDGILPGHEIVKIRLTKEDGSKKLILNLWNVFYLPNSLFNLVSLGLLNDIGIYHDNKNQILYNKVSPKPFAFTQHWDTSFLLHLLNLPVSAINLLKANNNVYKNIMPQVQVYYTQNSRLFFTIWHQQLNHLNFLALRQHLKHHNIKYNNDNHVYDNSKRVKATKYYNWAPQ